MNIIRIIRNNFKRSCNRRAGFLINLVIPIVVVVLGIFANSVSTPSFSIGIINETLAPDLVSTLSMTDGITIYEADPDTMKIDLITGKFSAVLWFTNSGYQLHSVKDETTNSQLKQVIDQYEMTSTPIRMEEVIGVEMSIAERTISFIVLFLMVTAAVTASLMIKDKQNGTWKRYQYSPQKPVSYILGNFFYNYLITMAQFLISISAAGILNLDMGISSGNLILTGVWLSGIATAFGTFFASLFEKEMYANLFASFTALILSLIGGTFIAYENMPAMLQKISIISPLRWLIDITKQMERGVGWFQNMHQVAILTAMIFALLMASSWINYRKNVL